MRMFFEKYSINFPVVCRVIDFALAALELLMIKVCGIIGISKIEFFNFSGTKRVKNGDDLLLVFKLLLLLLLALLVGFLIIFCRLFFEFLTLLCQATRFFKPLLVPNTARFNLFNDWLVLPVKYSASFKKIMCFLRS